MKKNPQSTNRVKLTAKLARSAAMQEFGTARGLEKSAAFIGHYTMSLGNLNVDIFTEDDSIVVLVKLMYGVGASVKYLDPKTLQENFNAIEAHYCAHKQEIINDWVDSNGVKSCCEQVNAIWERGIRR